MWTSLLSKLLLEAMLKREVFNMALLNASEAERLPNTCRLLENIRPIKWTHLNYLGDEYDALFK